MKSLNTLLLISSLLIISCTNNTNNKNPARENLCKYVKPFVGTSGEGNTYPGAVSPFGMIQISPDTDTKNWGAASGYEYTDSTIIGFSLTHLNGTGIPDLGDILFMPSRGKIKFSPGTKKNSELGYRTKFSHKNENAYPGYYMVQLPEDNIKVEVAAGERAGILKFTFPESDSSNIMTDLAHVLQWNVVWSNVRKENDTVITGYHQTNGWAKERYLYFAAKYSKAFDDFGIIENGKKKIYNTRRFRSSMTASHPKLQFFTSYKTKKNEVIMVKVGISAVSTANAMKNLDAEIPDWDFNNLINTTQKKWNKELGKIEIEGTKKIKETFYTSMYHAALTPTLYGDVDERYRGFDQNIHKSDNFTNYAVFSLWDTYRATHPLFSLIQSKRNADMINSMLAHYDQSVDHLLPEWSLNNNETWCMIGYHSVSVIADAYLKGVENFDAERAYEAIKTTAMNPDYDNVMTYSKIGYVPFDKENESVSKTLEYAYDDYCIAQMAKALNKNDDYKYFMKRAMSYKNIFDTETKLMRGKDSKGNWRTPFFPHGYINEMNKRDITEGTNYQYTWYVPHDVQGLINLMGNNTEFEKKLDTLFSNQELEETSAEGTQDILGRFGEYWHGNEPSHHIAFLYNYIGKPWKTQKLISKIMKKQYGNTPASLCGNDDCGQMSAWYIFNTMGFYPVCPASDYYVIGTPTVKNAVMHLSNGNNFKIIANNLSDKNFYIQSLKLNGKIWNKTYIPFSEITNGGVLIFNMGSAPNKMWGSSAESVPPSVSKKI